MEQITQSFFQRGDESNFKVIQVILSDFKWFWMIHKICKYMTCTL